jgi:hypothetical protein
LQQGGPTLEYEPATIGRGHRLAAVGIRAGARPIQKRSEDGGGRWSGSRALCQNGGGPGGGGRGRAPPPPPPGPLHGRARCALHSGTLALLHSRAAPGNPVEGGSRHSKVNNALASGTHHGRHTTSAGEHCSSAFQDLFLAPSAAGLGYEEAEADDEDDDDFYASPSGVGGGPLLSTFSFFQLLIF